MMRVVVLERIVGQQLLMQPQAALPTQHAIELIMQPILEVCVTNWATLQQLFRLHVTQI